MLSLGLFASIHSLLSSNATDQTFFKPSQFHLQLADLLVQLLFQFLVRMIPSAPAVLENLRQILDHQSLPLRHLARVYPVMTPYFLHCPLALHRLQGDLGLHFCTVSLSLFHSAYLSCWRQRFYTLFTCLIFGVQYSVFTTAIFLHWTSLAMNSKRSLLAGVSQIIPLQDSV